MSPIAESELSETVARLSKVLGKIEILSDDNRKTLDKALAIAEESQASLMDIEKRIILLDTGLEKRISETMKKFMDSELNICIK